MNINLQPQNTSNQWRKNPIQDSYRTHHNSGHLTHHLCRGCVPGEVVHARGGQVMLIVLRKLLELVLVVREASIDAEIPAGKTDRATK